MGLFILDKNMNLFTTEEKKILLEIADKAIKNGLGELPSLVINTREFSANLQANGASFVTLKIADELRGCIGTLLAYQPLIADVAQNAFAAAFQDPRFNPLTIEEYPLIKKEISILSTPQTIECKNEEDLLKQLQPGIDGLILRDKGRTCTYLPAVWKLLPIKKVFLQQLKLKAGFAEDYWSDTIQFEHYTVETVA
jgi:uncharacterized protein